MKVLFAGPSLSGSNVDLGGMEVRAPAAAGDIARAVDEGASAIGLIDGYFGAVAAVWHKEILAALSLGVRVLGAASMGALRAAECAPFGMVPVGVIANAYACGALDDDAAVVLLHGPVELGCPPFTEALVDAEATIRELAGKKLITSFEREALIESARALFFKDRTVEAMVARAGLGERAAPLLPLYEANRVGLKKTDAEMLVAALRALPDIRGPRPTGWRLADSPFWQRGLGTAGCGAVAAA